MNKMMKKAVILATVATMSTMAISAPASAYWQASSEEIDQYDVKDHQQYTLDYGRNVFVIDVYEKDGILFGTNRTIKWIDTDTGENGESTIGFWGTTRVYEAGTTFTWVDEPSGWDC